MSPVKLQPPPDASEEIAALIETLHATGQRLEDLTAGEVDGVADHAGHIFLLRSIQEQLRRSNAVKQATILDALPAHIALLDSQGGIVSVNQAWQQFAQTNGRQSAEYVIGANYLDICDRAQGAAAASATEKATAKHTAAGIRAVQCGTSIHFSMEYALDLPTRQRWFLMTASPFTAEPWHGVVLMRLDITEHKRVVQELSISERDASASKADASSSKADAKSSKADATLVHDIAVRLQAILDTVGDGVVTIDEWGTVESLNPPAEVIFGYTADEVIGRNVTLLMPEPYPGEHREYLANNRSTSEMRFIGTRREVMGMRKDGSTFPLDLSISEMKLHGKRHYTEAVRDITERNAAQQALAAAKAEAERANAAKDTFLANMSHEIRTPMNGVVGMIEVLQQSSLSAAQRDMANIIRDSSFALLGVINDILDFSKIESGKLDIDHLPMQVADVVTKAGDILDHLAQKKKVVLTVFTDPAIPAVLLGDPGRLRQILLNLANNAIKFSSRTMRPGQVTVRALLIDGSAEPLRQAQGERITSDQVWLKFEIADNGIGMDADSLARIFAPFMQADISTTRKYGGTGLGLVISQQLVTMMGGDIQVRSELDVGSVFTVSLPFDLAPQQIDGMALAAGLTAEPLMALPGRTQSPNVSLLSVPLRQRTERILVAEDNEINQTVILQQFALLGYVADMANDGREALAKWQQGHHALLLTDLHMPNMDGYELAAAIRQAEGKVGGKGEGKVERMPIIALTANAMKSEAQRCKAIGMDDYLTKPVLLGQLQTMLQQWLPDSGQADAEPTNQHGLCATPRDETVRPEPVEGRLYPGSASTSSARTVEFHVKNAEELVTSAQPATLFDVLDRSALPKQFGNNPALMARLFKDYQRSAHKAAVEIRAAIALEDCTAVVAAAHKLKSSSRAVGALALGEMCQQLEQAGKDGQVDAVRALGAEFETALAAALAAKNT